MQFRFDDEGSDVEGVLERLNLRSRLRFDLPGGRIWLDEGRMLLLHARAFGALRSELIDTLGVDRARGLLLRMGFVSGQQDADLALEIHGEVDPRTAFLVGPQMHAFEGLVLPIITEAHVDMDDGTFYGGVDWYGSWEAESHLQRFGVASAPACWSLVGYASGFASRFLGRFIVFKETQCVACGQDICHIVGKPAQEWDDPEYLKLFDPDDLEQELRDMKTELEQLRTRLREVHEPGKLVGQSPGFKAAFELLAKAAAGPINVLLLGETGVGKELFARWLHEHGRRAAEPFVAVNCAAIPHELIESELFGVEEGAYTGAQRARAGRFERADGGTLFLDEVGDLPPAAQVKLLRVLQSGEVERLGDERTRKVDVRIVSATNANLEAAVAEGRFRADLYYRIATYPVTIPPLRERKSDIPLLVEAMIERFTPIYHKEVRGVSDRARQLLLEHPWPGNVRELENLVERGVLLAPNGGLIEAEHLFVGNAPCMSFEPTSTVDAEGSVGAMGAGEAAPSTEPLSLEALYAQLFDRGLDLAEHEGRLPELAVERADGNLAQAARSLGITRRQLAYRLERRGS